MNEQVQKKHYLTEQIADFIKQFYEHFYLKKKGIKEVQKNISSTKGGDIYQEENTNLYKFFKREQKTTPLTCYL